MKKDKGIVLAEVIDSNPDVRLTRLKVFQYYAFQHITKWLHKFAKDVDFPYDELSKGVSGLMELKRLNPEMPIGEP